MFILSLQLWEQRFLTTPVQVNRQPTPHYQPSRPSRTKTTKIPNWRGDPQLQDELILIQIGPLVPPELILKVGDKYLMWAFFFVLFKKCKKSIFNQRLDCTAPKHGSKYTTKFWLTTLIIINEILYLRNKLN